MTSAVALGPPMWRGERGRTEVWYVTATDAATGLGLWVHAETVAPRDGSAACAHGWVAVFPAEGPAVVERFGPGPVEAAGPDAWFRLGEVVVGEGVLRGRSATIAWDLELTGDQPPLFTFPRAVWDRHLLPGAQVVPQPSARGTGTLSVGDRVVHLDGHAALARIFGHGSAERWGWLHAPLGHEGVLEIVTATARRPGLRRLPPLAMVQLRRPGLPDWPANPLTTALRMRTTLRRDGFHVVGGRGGCRLEVDVRLPADQQVALRYTDPDGGTATCTNSERASATITLTSDGSPTTWELEHTAHAEVGRRPADPTSI